MLDRLADLHSEASGPRPEALYWTSSRGVAADPLRR
jgi:hypothetical protein